MLRNFPKPSDVNAFEFEQCGAAALAQSSGGAVKQCPDLDYKLACPSQLAQYCKGCEGLDRKYGSFAAPVLLRSLTFYAKGMGTVGYFSYQ